MTDWNDAAELEKQFRKLSARYVEFIKQSRTRLPRKLSKERFELNYKELHKVHDELRKFDHRLTHILRDVEMIDRLGLVFPEVQKRGVADLANGNADGTEFRIILKKETSDEETASFASTGGFGQHGFYTLGMLDDVFKRLLDLTQKEDKPSVNLVQERSQEPLKALVLNTIAGGDTSSIRNTSDGGLWRDYYYSMHYAAIELLATNSYSRIHIGSIHGSRYEPEELRCIIEAFIHYARQSDHAKLELVVGGSAYFNYHVDGGHAYLDYIEEFVQDALMGGCTRVQTTESKEYGPVSGEDVRRFDLQRRIVHAPIKA